MTIWKRRIIIAFTIGLNLFAYYSCDNPLQELINQDVIKKSATTYQLTIDTSGEGSTTPSGTITVYANEAVDISALPGESYEFVGWSVLQGEGVTFNNENAAEATVTLNQQDATIRALFGIAVTDVSLSKSNIIITAGYTEQLTATIEPADALDQVLKWESSDPGVAMVSTEGLVTGVTQGIATITVENVRSGFSDHCTVEVYLPGYRKVYTAGSVLFALNFVPGVTFPTGFDDIGEATVNTFWMGETEATNELVSSVYQWAYDNGKFSGGTVNSTTVTIYGQELLDLDSGYIQISFGTGTFSVDSGFEVYPCVGITWYGSVLFCNWLTEIVNGNVDQVVYSGIDSTWMDDETVESISKTGWRLASKDEWECAARYIEDLNSDGDIKDPGEYYPGDHVSGDTTSYCYPSDGGTSSVFDQYAWIWENCGIDPQSHFFDDSGTWKGTHPVGTAGNSVGEGTPLTGNANQLGIYDMTGNVFEFCFTDNGLWRVGRSSGWGSVADIHRIANSGSLGADNAGNQIGFRFARTP